MAEGSSVLVWGGGIAAPRPMFKFAATSFSKASQVTRKKEKKNHTKIRAAGLRGEISAPYPHFKMCSKGTKKNSYAATFSSYVQDVFTCNMIEQSVPI